MDNNNKLLFFRKKLLQWANENPRPLPWKGEKNPYKIWLSEIILQQTRVEQGKSYYLKFCRVYPTVQDLAKAPEDEVLKHWEGLGYYTRARNLHKAAQSIVDQHNGNFPNTFAAIKALSGVGDYTASAIASFAFGLPHAVVDGNVQRVFARFCGVEIPVDSTTGKKHIQSLAGLALDRQKPAVYNQAIMDFGATHCTPKSPDCTSCPMQSNCFAFSHKKVNQLPIKKPKAKKINRSFIYFVVQVGSDTFLKKRVGKDIWKNLYEFPLHEIPKGGTMPDDWERTVRNQLFAEDTEQAYSIRNISKTYKQTLSHQYIHAVFVEIETSQVPKALRNEYIKINRIDIKNMIAVPRIIDWYLAENVGYLRLL